MTKFYDGPATDGIAVTPSDSTDLTTISRFIYIGSAGNLRVMMLSGANLTFNSVSAGTTLDIRAKRIFSTGTTANNILSLS